MRRVVITGIGAITPLGNSFIESWNALKAGQSGIREITRFDVSDLPWKVAGELKNFDPTNFLSRKEVNRLDPFVQYAVASAMMALDDSFGKFGMEFSRWSMLRKESGIIIGSSRGGITMIEREIKRWRPSAYLMPATTISMASSYIAQRLGINGYCLGISNACASGANAIGEAYRLISSGTLKTALAGGTEAPLTRICLEGYGLAGVLSKITSETPRPFDRKRDGFVLAEGACLLVLEDLTEALNRGARIYGEIIGYGNALDAFHITRPSPEGEAKAIRSALVSAGISQDEINLISTHGTGTQVGDTAELRAIKMIFHDRPIPSVAVKSMTGHMLAASSAFEVAVALMCIKEQVVPPIINISDIEDNHLLFFDKTRKMGINIAISNSFGFGGVNAILVLRRVV